MIAQARARLFAYADSFDTALRQVPAKACRRLALAALAIQLAMTIAAISSEVMLHADGSWYLLGIVAGKPWALVWHSLSARAAVYLFTVWPTVALGGLLHLSPLGFVRLYALFYYGVPLLQLALVVTLAWRRVPQRLLYPLIGWGLGTLFVFGFPSEIVLAPGFLWLALFLAERPRPSLWLLLPWGLAVWSHELALPAALVTMWLAVRNASNGGWGRSPRAVALLAGAALILAAWIVIGGAGFNSGSNHNAKYVFEPTRLANAPSYWLFLIAALGVERLASRGRGALAFPVICAVVLLLPPLAVLAMPIADFAAGRYEAGRTFTGILLFLLALIYAWASTKSPAGTAPLASQRTAGPARLLALAYATGVGTGAAFLMQWTLALQGYRATVLPGAAAPAYVTAEQAIAQMRPRQARAAEQTGFLWVLPLRSLILADGATPRQIVYQAGYSYSYVCATMQRGEPGPALRTDLYDDVRRFACAHLNGAPN